MPDTPFVDGVLEHAGTTSAGDVTIATLMRNRVIGLLPHPSPKVSDSPGGGLNGVPSSLSAKGPRPGLCPDCSGLHLKQDCRFADHLPMRRAVVGGLGIVTVAWALGASDWRGYWSEFWTTARAQLRASDDTNQRAVLLIENPTSTTDPATTVIWEAASLP